MKTTQEPGYKRTTVEPRYYGHHRAAASEWNFEPNGVFQRARAGGLERVRLPWALASSARSTRKNCDVIKIPVRIQRTSERTDVDFMLSVLWLLFWTMALEGVTRFSTASPGCQDATRKVSRVSLHLKSRRKHGTTIGGRPAAGELQVENEPGMGRPSTADHKERLQQHSRVPDVARGGESEAGTAVVAVKPCEVLVGSSEASREQEAATRSGTPGNGEKRVLSPDPDRSLTPEFVPEDWWIELACDFWQVDEKEVLRIIGRARHEGATDGKVTNHQVSGESIPSRVTADLNVPASEDRSSFPHNQGLTARPRRRVGGKLVPNIHEFDRLPTIPEETGFVPEDWWVELACEFWKVNEDEVMRIVRGMGCDVADDKAVNAPITNAISNLTNEGEQSCQNQNPPSRTRRRVGGKLVPNIHEFDQLPTIPEEPSETPETEKSNQKPNKKAKAEGNPLVNENRFPATENSRKKTATRGDLGKRAAKSGAAPSKTAGRQSPVPSGDTTTCLPSLTNPGPANTRENSQHFTRGMMKGCDSTSSQNSSRTDGSGLRLPRLDATPGREVQLTFQPKPPARPAPEERTNARARRILKFAKAAAEQQSARDTDHKARCARPSQQPRAPEVTLPRPPAVPRCPTEKSRSRLNAVRKAGKVKVIQNDVQKLSQVCCYWLCFKNSNVRWIHL